MFVFQFSPSSKGKYKRNVFFFFLVFNLMFREDTILVSKNSKILQLLLLLSLTLLSVLSSSLVLFLLLDTIILFQNVYFLSTRVSASHVSIPTTFPVNSYSCVGGNLPCCCLVSVVYFPMSFFFIKLALSGRGGTLKCHIFTFNI